MKEIKKCPEKYTDETLTQKKTVKIFGKEYELDTSKHKGFVISTGV